jgi:hypothetical protein
MNTFKIGTNFDLALLDKIVELNKTYPNSLINEVYGSTREMAFVAARPDFRLPDVDKKMLEDYVKRCNELGICRSYLNYYRFGLYDLNVSNSPLFIRALNSSGRIALSSIIQSYTGLCVSKLWYFNPMFAKF